MAFLSSMWRAKRGDFNFFLVAALVALLIMPGAAHGALPPQGCEAVLFWLQNEPTAVVASQVGVPSSFVAITHQKAEEAHQISVEEKLSLATQHCGQFSTLASPFPLAQPQWTPWELERELPVVARLNGVRTNRRLI